MVTSGVICRYRLTPMRVKYFTLKLGPYLILGSCCVLRITCCFTLFCSASALWAKNSQEFFRLNYFKKIIKMFDY